MADRVLILENAYYSVISPEGCAAILWKDRAASAKAAEALKITAKDLLELKLVDEIVPEPLGGAHTNPAATAATLKIRPAPHLGELLAMPGAERLKKRYEKFRAHGHFLEKDSDAGGKGRGKETLEARRARCTGRRPLKRHAACELLPTRNSLGSERRGRSTTNRQSLIIMSASTR